MNFNQIIDIAKKVYLDDQKAPILWTYETLEVFGNEAVREACRRSELIEDFSTLSVCRQSLVSGQAVYPASAKITRIKTIVLASDGTYTLTGPLTEEALNIEYPAWRSQTGGPLFYTYKGNQVRYVPIPDTTDTATLTVARLPLFDCQIKPLSITGTANISFVAATKTISKAGENFLFKGAIPGNILTVTGTTNNNGNFTVASVTETAIVVSETLVDESNTSATIQMEFVPEIPEMYHLDLVDWICHLSYNKRDSETEDASRETKYSRRFDAKFGPRPSANAEHYRKYLPRDARMRSGCGFGF
jgi:hypothetical protein